MRTSRSSLALTGALALALTACGSNTPDVGLDTGGTEGNEVVASPTPLASLPELTGGQTSVTLDPGFVQGLTSLQLAPGPVGDARLAGGVASFPVTGGTATYYSPGSVEPYVQGRIEHEGSGLSLTKGGTRVELTDFTVDPGRSVLTGDVRANGQPAAADAPLFFLDGRTLEPLRTEGSTAVLEGTQVKLTAEAAQLLNSTFGTDALTEFFLVGVARIELALPPAAGSSGGAQGSAEPAASPSAG